ncbi:MAG: hypothetical protein GY811_01315 [Myxococcales bacterium]|nr:hypothetical protein [Myxococcales bacterium]
MVSAAFVPSLAMSYLGGMGIGSLSKYRRPFMIGGFVIFAAGALLRWHHGRQLDSMQSAPAAERGPAIAISWHENCVTYACRIAHTRGPECKDMCERAAQGGSPKVQAERIANACNQQCVADEDLTTQCRIECFVSEAARLPK